MRCFIFSFTVSFLHFLALFIKSLKSVSKFKNLASALGLLVEEVKFRTSKMRATAEYRYHLVGTLLKETLDTAWERAGKF